MVQEQVRIQAPLQRVYKTFADLEHWRAALPDVLDVQVLYDDGEHQEFLMTVDRPAGPETIRGVRYLDSGKTIELFQPTPPPGFRKMCGTWRFTETSEGTDVQATRLFEVDGRTVLSQSIVADKLRHYLRTNLALFKAYIENGTIRDP